MFKSFYDPEVEKRGMKIGEEQSAERIARNLLLKSLNVELVAEVTELSLEKVKELKDETML